MSARKHPALGIVLLFTFVVGCDTGMFSAVLDAVAGALADGPPLSSVDNHSVPGLGTDSHQTQAQQVVPLRQGSGSTSGGSSGGSNPLQPLVSSLGNFTGGGGGGGGFIPNFGGRGSGTGEVFSGGNGGGGFVDQGFSAPTGGFGNGGFGNGGFTDAGTGGFNQASTGTGGFGEGVGAVNNVAPGGGGPSVMGGAERSVAPASSGSGNGLGVEVGNSPPAATPTEDSSGSSY